MVDKRIIAKLEVKSDSVIKGVHFEGLKKIGDPVKLAKLYSNLNIDEFMYVDTVASLYGRNNLTDIVKKTAKELDLPLTVEGGIKSISDISTLLASGAEKVAINTGAVDDRSLLSKAVEVFGSQCIVSSIYVKYAQKKGKWYIWTDNARVATEIELSEWLAYVQACGVGEIVINSIDNDGLMKGFDYKLLSYIAGKITVPLIFCGGCSSMDEANEVLKNNEVDAISMSSILHEKRNELVGVYQKPVCTETTKNREFCNLQVAIIDMNISNIFSAVNSFAREGATVTVINSKVDLKPYDLVVLPGSGSFPSGMSHLTETGLDSSIKNYESNGGLLFGICLGSQLLMKSSGEIKQTQGLGLVPGTVKPLPELGEDIKTPFVGWSGVLQNKVLNRQEAFRRKEEKYYFTHSWYVDIDDQYKISEVCLKNSRYTAMYYYKNIIGCQFHPEKSKEYGKELIKEILSIVVKRKAIKTERLVQG